jgi:adenine C2-methylase RlmN of 23S rRNA A2503 and tRNA A37
MTDADHIIVHVRDTTTTNAAMFEIQISLHATGIELKKMLIPLVKLPLEQMKIIFSGR